MKISKLFHWLYASVMMLPLFASIVFAIYTRNENSTFTQSVDYQINRVVNFNQLVNVSDTEGFVSWSGGTYNITDSRINVYCNDSSSTINSQVLTLDINIVGGHKYLVLANYLSSSQPFLLYSNTTSLAINSVNTASADGVVNLRCYKSGGFPSFIAYSFYLECFDLTDMFGYGYEPTLEQFNAWYTDTFYSYNSGTKQLLNNYSTETYNNTDVVSQLFYTLYNSTSNYFNVTNFLGLNNLYDWISINVFNGTPALAFSLFYMLLCYWLLVSIFWLVFDVVMYVPNLAHRWLDKGSLQ